MAEAVSGAAAPRADIVRGTLTWHFYLFFGFFQFLINIQGNILPFLKEELGLSYRVVGLMPSAFAVGFAITGTVGSFVTRRFGRRTMLIFGVAGVAIGGILICLAGSAAESIGATLLMGICNGFIISTVYATLSEMYGERKSIAYNEINAMCYAFGIGAPLLTGAAVSLGLGWRSVLVLDAAFGLVLLASFLRLAMPAAPHSEPGVRRGRLPATYWIYWTALAFGISMEFCALLWAPAYLENVIGLGTAGAATAAATFPVAMFIGRFAGSRLVRRFTPSQLLVAAFAAQAAGFALYFAGGNAVLAIAGLFVLGLGTSVLYPLLFGLAMEAAGAETDLGSARSLLAGAAALLTMPVALGTIADLVGLHLAHLIMPVLIAATIAVFLAGRASERRSYSASSS